jgi:hypothetical protein
MAESSNFPYDVFFSHSAKDKAGVRVSSLSASNGERAGVRCRSQLSAERLHAKAEVRRKKEEIAPQPSAFILQPFSNGSLAQFLCANGLPTQLN